jgi:hypothetical protein
MTMNATRAMLLVLLALATGGCATMSKEECRSIDWRTVGYEDGATGQSVERLSERRRACARHGVVPDLDAYRLGRDEGLLEYCRPANAFRVGSAGRGYDGACPAHLAAGFGEAYEAGRQLWRLERRMDDAVNGIIARRNEIERIDGVLVNAGLVIVGEGTTSEERAQALLNTRNLSERRKRLQDEIHAMERELPLFELELADYRDWLSRNPYW